MSGPFKLKYTNSAFPFKSPLKEVSFGPRAVKPVKPISAEEAARTGRKRGDLIINAARNWREKLTNLIKPSEHDDTRLADWVVPSKQKKQEKIEVGPLSPGIVVPDE